MGSDKAFSSRENEISLLKYQINTLRELCNKIDPFQEISEEDKNTLSQFGISDYSNPYQVTNELIAKTEDKIEKLHHLKQ